MDNRGLGLSEVRDCCSAEFDGAYLDNRGEGER